MPKLIVSITNAMSLNKYTMSISLQQRKHPIADEQRKEKHNFYNTTVAEKNHSIASSYI